jgi:hypothetical protein
MRAVNKALISAAGVAALLAAVGTSPAEAGLINFTWNPSGAATPLTSVANAEFTSNDLTVGDFAVINATSLSSVTESALLEISNLNAVPPGGAGIVGNGVGGAGDYQLYFSVTATSSLSGSPLSGTFSSLSYTLYGVVGGGCTFAANSTSGPTASGCGTTVALATGGLAPGANAVGINQFNEPTASANATISPTGTAGTFFVNPSSFGGVDFQSLFGNTQLVSYFCNASGTICTSAGSGGSYSPTTPFIEIKGGGGDVNMFSVPEPLTLSLFGVGLVGVAAARRRSKKKA